ncbi:MAG TPA: oligopeptide/dipeptide ABC transporter ATP-binding protein [Victivallales bacterium]|nr:oligopeptide/dipeptide ABC transporter ATP-binding protein [Victivallales bacterium]
MENNTILEVKNLKKYFPITSGLLKRNTGSIRAVDNVNFSINSGETIGIVGESGCGKTTLGRTIIRLHDPTEGEILFKLDNSMIDLASLTHKELKSVRSKIQYIFQDPFASLNSRMTVCDLITEPLVINKIGNRRSQVEKAKELLVKVGLKPTMLDRYPHEFSGWQRQRIVIARALVLEPDFIICDEAVSALDVSVQSQVINLLKDLQNELNITYIFIAHGINVVNYISDRVMVMYLGRIMEIGKTDSIFCNPKHPYTEALLSAVPVPKHLQKTKNKKRITLTGNIPSPSNPPSGCYFHPRCRYATEVCKTHEYSLTEVEKGSDHFTSCIRYNKLNLSAYSGKMED